MARAEEDGSCTAELLSASAALAAVRLIPACPRCIDLDGMRRNSRYSRPHFAVSGTVKCQSRKRTVGASGDRQLAISILRTEAM
jgi:hypothetical protein